MTDDKDGGTAKAQAVASYEKPERKANAPTEAKPKKRPPRPNPGNGARRG